MTMEGKHTTAATAADPAWPVQLFAYPFRIFFVSLAAWAVLVVPLWLLLLFGTVELPLALPALYWHRHEMIFGILNPAIAGFLLTAVATWTGIRGTRGMNLLGLWLVWLIGRLGLLFGDLLPTPLALLPDLLFLPLVMTAAGWRILRARQRRQIVLLVVLALLWLMQLGFHLQPEGHFSGGALILAIALMLVIGGRITPAFSANWLRARGGDPGRIIVRPWLDLAAIGSTLLLWAALLLELQVAVLPLAVAAAVLTGARLWLWRGWLVRGEPLLWILHLSLLWIPLALMLLAGGRLGWWPATAWLHAAGVGAMGGLILGVISRVALGHTGRALQLPRGMVSAFILIQLAALTRVLTALTLLPWQRGLEFSALCWMLAFGLFLWRYTGILSSPRADGEPG